MGMINYLDFDLLIESSPKGSRARVLSSPAGQAAADFRLPFSELEIENFLLRIGRTRRGVRRLESPEMEAAKTFGGRLFEAVFDDEVRGCLRSSLDEADRRGAGLRIRLRLTDVPELADLPWEYLYNPTLNRFLVLSAETPLVRYLDLLEPIRPLAVKPPLRVLVMIASPNDYPSLNVEGEWVKLKEALGDLEQRGLLALERLEPATLTALQRRLRRGEYHIFHFVGHGAFDERAQDGLLLLEDEGGRGRAVSGQYLGTLMHDERTLRLAILNACEGARTSRSDPFAGAAQSLVQQGVPAVIAMQSEISDEAAIALSHEFYAALADGYPVDAALAEARKAVFAQGNDVEWGKPVLYLRSPDGRIFDVERVSERERRQAQIATLYRQAKAAMTKGEWAAAIEKLQTVLAMDPNHAQAAADLSQARQQQDRKKAPPASRPTRPRSRDWLRIGIPVAVVALLLICGGGGYALFKLLNPGSIAPATFTPIPLTSKARVSVSSWASAGKDFCGNTVDYSPRNLADSEPGTAWRVVGDGRGAWIQFDFEHEVVLSSLSILPGYNKVDPCEESVNWCLYNRIPKEIRLEAMSGERVELSLDKECAWQHYDIGPWRTVWLRMTILSSYPSDEEHPNVRTAISEVALYGSGD